MHRHMKKAFGFILFFSFTTLSAQLVSLNDLPKHMNTTVKVCGKIYNGIFLESVKNSPTLLNMGGIYPNHQLTLLIWSDNLKDFPPKPEQYYANTQVCVTGLVIDYKGKPEIVLKSPAQIELGEEITNKTSGAPILNKTDALEQGDVKLAGNVNLRLMPDTEAPVVFVIGKGSIITVQYSMMGWSRVTVKKAANKEAQAGKEGYIKESLLQTGNMSGNVEKQTTAASTTDKGNMEPAKIVIKPTIINPVPPPADNSKNMPVSGLTKDDIKLSTTVDMRKGPGENYALITPVKAGTIVTILFSANGWSQVIIKNSKDANTSEGYIRNSLLQ